MRHRPPHHGHVFSGGYYASAYYSYMWSEVLDADAFAAFEETGDIFNPEVAKKLREARALGRRLARIRPSFMSRFRGRLPTAEALLKKTGLSRRCMTQREPQHISASACLRAFRWRGAWASGLPVAIRGGRSRDCRRRYPSGSFRRSGSRTFRASRGRCCTHTAPRAVVSGLRRTACKQRRGRECDQKSEWLFFIVASASSDIPVLRNTGNGEFMPR